MRKSILLLGLACGLAVGFKSTAALIVHEPFDYPAGNLTSLNGGTGWPAAWTNTGNGTVVSPGLAYDDIWNQLLSSSNACGMNTVANPRDLPGTYGSAGQTIYVSFIGRVDSAFAAGLSLNNGNAFGCRIGRVTQPTWQVADLTGVVIDSGLPSTQTSLLVVRLDFAASTVTLRLYVNPPLAAEPATPTGSATRPTFTFNRVHVLGSGANVRLIDEIRLGTTWADVTPHAPAPLQCYVGNVSLPEGNSGTTDFVFNVGLNEAANQPVTVDFLTANGTALVGSDYVATNGSLIFNPGETNQTVTVRVNGDATVEYDESFRLVLTNSVNAGISTQFGSGTGTILDDDFVAPALFAEEQFRYPNGSAISGLNGGTGWSNTWIGSFGGATVTAPGLTHTDGGSSLAVSSNAATLNGDFVAQTRQIRDLDRVKDGTLYVSFLGRVDSGQVALTLNKSGVPRFSIGRNFFSANWNVSHPLGDWSVPSAVPATTQSFIVLRVDYSGANMTVRLYVNPALSAEPAVPVGQTNLPAARFDSIALSTSGFSGGAAVFDEIRVATTWAGAAPLGPPPPPGITITDAVAHESNTGTNLMFRVALSHATTSNVTVNFATSNGSAIAGSDHVATNGMLAFAPGETTRSIVVAVIGDAVAETNESFSVLLSNPVNATITDGAGIGAILDDDTPPRLAIGPGRVMEGDTGITNAAFRVRLEKIYSGTVSVSYHTTNGTATAGSDYAAANGTVIFAPGETWKWIAVPVFGDTTVELNETFGVIMSNPLNCALVNTNGPGLIGDDDTAAPGVTNLTLLKNGDAVPGEPDRVFKQFISAPVINAFNELAFVASTMLMNGTAVETNLWLWLGPTNDLRKVAGTQMQPPETPPGSSYSGEFLFPNLDDEGNLSYLAEGIVSDGGAPGFRPAARTQRGSLFFQTAVKIIMDSTPGGATPSVSVAREGEPILDLESLGPVIFQGGQDASACAAPQHESFELGHHALFLNNDQDFSSIIYNTDFGTSTLELAPGQPSPFDPRVLLTFVKRVWSKGGDRGYILRSGTPPIETTTLALHKADGTWIELISTGDTLVSDPFPVLFFDVDATPGFIDGCGDWFYFVAFHRFPGPGGEIQGLYALHKTTREIRPIFSRPGALEFKLHAQGNTVVFSENTPGGTRVHVGAIDPATGNVTVEELVQLGQSVEWASGLTSTVERIVGGSSEVTTELASVRVRLANGLHGWVFRRPGQGGPARFVYSHQAPDEAATVLPSDAGLGSQRGGNADRKTHSLTSPAGSSLNWHFLPEIRVTPATCDLVMDFQVPRDYLTTRLGDCLEFTLTVSNKGPNAAYSPALEFNLSEGLSVVDLSSSFTELPGCPLDFCLPSRIDPGQQITVTGKLKATIKTKAAIQSVLLHTPHNILVNPNNASRTFVLRSDIELSLLRIDPAPNNQVRVSWTGPGRLEQTSDLGPDGIWMPLAGDPPSPVSVNIGDDRMFFHVVQEAPQPLVFPYMNFYQNHLSLDDMVISNSAWGEMDLTFLGTGGLQYLNVNLNNQWIVRDLPVPSILGSNQAQTITVNIPIGDGSGPVEQVQNGFTFTPMPMGFMPIANRQSEVEVRWFWSTSGLKTYLLTNVEPSVMEGGDAPLFAGVKPVFRNYEQNRNECALYAVYNSLEYLNCVWGLGMNRVDYSPGELQTALQWNFDGVPPGIWPGLKQQFLDRKNLPITTEVTIDPRVAMAALRQCCAVEAEIDGHATCVTAMASVGGGKYVLWFSDDPGQNGTGRVATYPAIWDTATDELRGIKDSRKFHFFVIECPSQEALSHRR